MKRVAILGSTGSIGTQALEVVEANPGIFKVEVLTANDNVDLLVNQAKKYRPYAVIIRNEKKYNELKNALEKTDIKVFAGKKAIEDIVEMDSVDIVLTAMVGYSGLLPTINAIKHKKTIALANKETLVVAGELITKLCKEYNVDIYPVDSEHSAIFQCLAGESNNPIEKIVLTASGGPFRGKSIDFIRKATKHQALKHPNWDMGAKITIDSASLMNKGLEMIEAKWLFGLNPDQIDIIVHPQSVIHSIVQFEDGSMKAQMGLPDMKLPIQYALGYPERIKNAFPRFNFADYPELTFEKPEIEKFRNLEIALYALDKGGNLPCIMNAANEIVVDAFLNDRIGFLDMPNIIEQTMEKFDFKDNLELEDYIQTDSRARNIAQTITGDINIMRSI